MRAAFEASNRGNLDAWLADADPDIEWHVLPEATDPGPHRDREVILEQAKLWRQTFGGLRADVLEYLDAGDYVIAPVRMRGQPPGSDAEVVSTRYI